METSDQRHTTGVLGPLLFVIYINDLPSIADTNTHIYLFADDTKIFKEISTYNDCTKLQEDINKMYEWSQKWLLLFHPDKCKIMRIGKSKIPSYQYDLGGVKLGFSEFEKDIGVTIDTELTFGNHMIEKINKANSTLGIIRRTIQCLDKEVFLLLYKGLVRPILETKYGAHIKRKI